MLTSPGARKLRAPVAQWIEHLPSKQRAAGSSPAGGTIQAFDSRLPSILSPCQIAVYIADYS
jgi:hypothetical protein